MKQILISLALLCSLVCSAQTKATEVSADSLNSSYKSTLNKMVNISNRLDKWTVKEGTTYYKGHDYVDLGLSVMWATCNLGADNPEDYGKYYSWGETTGYASTESHNFDWSTYKWCGGSQTTLTKYCIDSNYGTVDSLRTLQSTDDAATANWGYPWRIPSYDEWNELMTNCTWTLVADGSTVSGYNVTGPNGNSIFLPAAGGWNGTSYSNYAKWGIYWTNLISTKSAQYAFFVQFSNTYINFMDYGWHFSGHSVRAVCPASRKMGECSFQESSVTIDEGTTYSQVPTTNSDGAITYTSSDPSIATVDAATGVVTALTVGSVTITASMAGTDICAPAKATYTLKVEHASVDLGLPSGTKWASYNVGAENPEDNGLYFAWGETTGYSSDIESHGRGFDWWADYKWMASGYTSWMYVTKYTYADGNTNCYWYSSGTYVGTTVDGVTYKDKRDLDPADDAATANWGDSWRMPTNAEITELMEKCTWTWTTKNGVSGYEVKGTNGNSIFLPAAGYINNSALNVAGTEGAYWTNTLTPLITAVSCCRASYLKFTQDDGASAACWDRYEGYSVRAIRK